MSKRLGGKVDHWALTLGIIGLGVVALHNWRRWQRDKVMLAERTQVPALEPLQEWPRLPRVSMLVAAWNEETTIAQHIESFRLLRYPNKQLILCAGGTDRTFERAVEHASEAVRVLEQRPGEGKQRALQRCFAESDGAVIFLTDADCRLDNESFERTLYPVVAGLELVISGGVRPYPELLSNPFVIAQAASQIYAATRMSGHIAALHGRNCAVARMSLERSRGLDEPAPTGTDYVLAKMLARSGVRIRQLPQSQIATEYPTTIQGYIRQQRRWLRNGLLHGYRFGALDEMRTSLRTSLVGLGMLTLPLLGVVLGPLPVVVWMVLLMQALLTRLRYLRFAAPVLAIPLQRKMVAAQVPALFVDYLAWAWTLLDCMVPGKREAW